MVSGRPRRRLAWLVPAALAWAATALSAPGIPAQEPARPGSFREHEARALTDLARAALREGKVGDALEFHLAALAIYRETGGRAGAAATLFEVGRINNDLFNYEAAVARLTEAAAIYRGLGAQPELARVNLALGRSQMMLGRRLDAIAAFEEALGEFERSGDAARADQARALLGRVK
jgi:tetratricopeptide (TPR) repeat protein